MIERILVTTDGTESSEPALDEARELAGRLNSALSVLHVIPDLAWDFPEADDSKYLYRYYLEQQRSLQQGKHVLSRALAYLQGVPVQGLLRDAVGRSIADVIVHEAQEQHSDLIVMSTLSRGGLRFFSVSTTQAVLRRAKQPVLLVHVPPARARSAWRAGTARGAIAR